MKDPARRTKKGNLLNPGADDLHFQFLFRCLLRNCTIDCVAVSRGTCSIPAHSAAVQEVWMCMSEVHHWQAFLGTTLQPCWWGIGCCNQPLEEQPLEGGKKRNITFSMKWHARSLQVWSQFDSHRGGAVPKRMEAAECPQICVYMKWVFGVNPYAFFVPILFNKAD